MWTVLGAGCGAPDMPADEHHDPRARACAEIETRARGELRPLIDALAGPVLASPELASVVERTYGERLDRRALLEMAEAEPRFTLPD